MVGDMTNQNTPLYPANITYQNQNLANQCHPDLIFKVIKAI